MAAGGEQQPTFRTARAQRTVRPLGMAPRLRNWACGPWSPPSPTPRVPTTVFPLLHPLDMADHRHGDSGVCLTSRTTRCNTGPAGSGAGPHSKPWCCCLPAAVWEACFDAVIWSPKKRGGGCTSPAGREAEEGKGPPRRPQRRLGRRLEEVAEAIGGGYFRVLAVWRDSSWA